MTLKSNISASRPQSSLFGREKLTDTLSSGWTTAFTDGGSRGNPGPAGYGAVVQNADGETVAELSDFLGMRTNNVAEYSGMLAALEYALANGLSRLRIVSDSELMVKQMRGQYRVQSPELRPLYEEAKRRVAKLESFQIEHVLRGKNKKADELANQAMDRGMGRKPDLRSASAPKATALPGTTSHNATQTVESPIRPLRGMMKNGKISLLEGSIPEGTIVVVMPEKALGERVAKRNAK